jgi:transcriptional regulator with XRE-family HTH domain
MDLGSTLKSLRLERKETLHKVAMGTDIDMTTLSKVEHKERMPTEEQIKRLAHYFDVNADKLLAKLTAEKILYEYGVNNVTYDALHMVMEAFTDEYKVSTSADTRVENG